MKLTLKAVLIAIAVVIVILLYGGIYTLEEGSAGHCRAVWPACGEP